MLTMRNPRRKKYEPVNPADHLGLARWMAVRFRRRRGAPVNNIEDTEEYADGCLGLLEAAKRFRPELGFKFTTYATWWVRQQIQRGLQLRARASHVPFSELDFDLDDNTRGLADLLAAPIDAEQTAGGETFWDRLWPLLNLLDPRPRRILFKRLCGIPLVTIGEEEDPPISKERVRQIEDKAIATITLTAKVKDGEVTVPRRFRKSD